MSGFGILEALDLLLILQNSPPLQSNTKNGDDKVLIKGQILGS